MVSSLRLEDKMDEKEYFFVSALTDTITDSSDTWLIDNDSSRHMTCYRDSLRDLTEKDSTLQVELGDNAKYVVKAVGTTSFQLESGDSLHMRDVLFVPGLKKNMLSISTLEDRG
jgi:hypothetical protein